MAMSRLLSVRLQPLFNTFKIFKVTANKRFFLPSWMESWIKNNKEREKNQFRDHFYRLLSPSTPCSQSFILCTVRWTKLASFIDKCVQSVSFLNTVCHRFIAVLAVLEYFTFLKDNWLNSLGFFFGLTDCKESSIFLFSAQFIVDNFCNYWLYTD